MKNINLKNAILNISAAKKDMKKDKRKLKRVIKPMNLS